MRRDPRGFWKDKAPCWESRRCVPEACRRCIAYRDQSRPCWEYGNTLCKEMGIDTCFVCEVYKQHGPPLSGEGARAQGGEDPLGTAGRPS
jgi:hypothetical protein